MTHNAEAVTDENGFEILVSYDYEQSESQVEEGHGYHEVGLMIETVLTSVEIVIGGIGVDIIHLLGERQKEFIISKLSYE